MLPRLNTEYFDVYNTSDTDAVQAADVLANKWLPADGQPDTVTRIRIRALTGPAFFAVTPPKDGNLGDFRRWLHDIAREACHVDDRPTFDALSAYYQMTLGLTVREATEGAPDPSTAPPSK